MRRFPLTLIEEYLFAEDKPAYPCWIVLRFHFRGTLQRDVLQQAWRAVVRRHVTLHSVIRSQPNSTWAWEPVSESHDPQFTWHSDVQQARHHAWSSVDITREPAVRLVGIDRGDTCELVLEGHHAIFDGVASFAVVHELLLAYAQQLGARVILPELRPEMFPHRGKFGLSWWKQLKMLPVQAIGLWFAWQMQRRNLVSLTPAAAVAVTGPVPPDFPAALHRIVPAAEVTQLRATAKHHAVSLNDLLVRDLQSAIGAWRHEYNPGRAEDWVAVGIPVSLRRPADRFLPAANLIGLVAIERQARSLANRARLLRRAHEDMELVKRHQLGYTFLVLLAFRRQRRGGIARYASTPESRATAVLTNLGQPFARSPLLDGTKRLRLPGAVLERYQALAPCRPGTQASFAVCLYAGELQVDLHYDARALSAVQASALLDLFFTQLDASARGS